MVDTFVQYCLKGKLIRKEQELNRSLKLIKLFFDYAAATDDAAAADCFS